MIGLAACAGAAHARADSTTATRSEILRTGSSD
jgi:hypothetical protein